MKLTVSIAFLSIFFLCSTLHFAWVDGAKILVVTFIAAKSHKMTYWPLIEELGKRGHNITHISTVVEKEPQTNIKEIQTISWKPPFNVFKAKKSGSNLDINLFINLDIYKNACGMSYDLPLIKQILEEKFDLIFTQPLYNDCILGLVYRLQAPLVLFFPMPTGSFFVEKFGGHLPTSFTPFLFSDYTDEMSFTQRLHNFALTIIFEGILRFHYEPAMTALYREKLGQDIPPVREILSNASLIFQNGHFTLHKPRPLLPNVVDVGGLHSFHPPKPLPKEMEEFINKGKDGFILFSMGSAIQVSMMPDEQRQMFLNVFSKLKQQVIWKWEAEPIKNLPNNVMLSAWLPQQDLLAHKDIKMFITHCGGGSTEEAIYNGVPLIGTPLFVEQPLNAKVAESHGIIVRLDWNDLTEEILSNAINEVINNPKYRENAKRISAIFRDQPDNPLERAVYWVEYVIRHKGAPHLRTAGRKLNWFQYHSYDVILTFLGLFLGTLWLIFKTLKWVHRKIFGRSSPPTKSTKKSKAD